MGIPILVIWHLYIETDSCLKHKLLHRKWISTDKYAKWSKINKSPSVSVIDKVWIDVLPNDGTIYRRMYAPLELINSTLLAYAWGNLLLMTMH